MPENNTPEVKEVKIGRSPLEAVGRVIDSARDKIPGKRELALIGAGVGLVFMSAGCGTTGSGEVSAQQSGSEIIALGQVVKENQPLLNNQVWGNLTEVLNPDLFPRDNFEVEQINPHPNQDVSVTGFARSQRNERDSHSSQLGVNYSLNYGPRSVVKGEELTLNIAGGENITMGESRGGNLEINAYIGKDAGDVKKDTMGRLVVHNPEEMRQRFEDMTGLLKKILNIPKDTLFIPDEDWNGLTTYVPYKTGYALVVAGERIDGKSITFKLTAGLVTDPNTWRAVTEQYARRVAGLNAYISPDKLDLERLLDVALRRVKENKAAPANGYIEGLKEAIASRYNPNEAK